MKWWKRFDSRHSLLNMYAYLNSFNRDSIGSELKNLLVVSNGNKVTLYRLMSEIIEHQDIWKKKVLDLKYMQQRFDWVAKLLTEAKEFSKELKTINFKEVTNSKLFQIYVNYFEMMSNIFQGYNMSQPEVPAIAEKEIQKLLIKQTAEEKMIESFCIITTPTESHILQEEEINWLKILLEVKQKGITKAIDNKIKEHSDRFGWISTQEGLPYLSTKYYTKLALSNDESIQKINDKITQKEKYIREIKQKQKKILNSMNDNKIKDLSYILRKAGHLRLLKRLAWTKLEFCSENLFRETSNRIKIPNEMIKYFFPSEIRKYLIMSKKPNHKKIKSRIKNYLMILRNGKLKLYTGKEAKKVEKIEIIIKNNNTNQVTGTCANPGIAKGRVKIIYSHSGNQIKEISKMKKGDILVTGSTKPQLILACRKAAAIVTDEGGITSHAAVVSRELGIPCIVNANIATSVFKDGEMIEVDATQGIARKI